MKKFLFLDVDGVICLDDGLSKSCVENVKKLISTVPNLEVVLISTRRADDTQCIQIQQLLGVSYLHRTPLLHTSDRSDEIGMFLDSVSEPYNFVIVDDDNNLYSHYFENLIVCNRYIGFSSDVLGMSLKMLRD